MESQINFTELINLTLVIKENSTLHMHNEFSVSPKSHLSGRLPASDFIQAYPWLGGQGMKETNHHSLLYKIDFQNDID